MIVHLQSFMIGVCASWFIWFFQLFYFLMKTKGDTTFLLSVLCHCFPLQRPLIHSRQLSVTEPCQLDPKKNPVIHKRTVKAKFNLFNLHLIPLYYILTGVRETARECPKSRFHNTATCLSGLLVSRRSQQIKQMTWLKMEDAGSSPILLGYTSPKGTLGMSCRILEFLFLQNIFAPTSVRTLYQEKSTFD